MRPAMTTLLIQFGQTYIFLRCSQTKAFRRPIWCGRLVAAGPVLFDQWIGADILQWCSFAHPKRSEKVSQSCVTKTIKTARDKSLLNHTQHKILFLNCVASISDLPQQIFIIRRHDKCHLIWRYWQGMTWIFQHWEGPPLLFVILLSKNQIA